MVNPYQAPAETPAGEDPGCGDADFSLTPAELRFAESRFLLHRFGGRLTLASLLMVFLAVAVVFVDIPFLRFDGFVAGFQISLAVRELFVMVSATLLYLGLVRTPRERLRRQLEYHGVVAEAGISVEIHDGVLRWSGPRGAFEFRLSATDPEKTSKGVLVSVSADLFLFIPRRAHFAAGNYRQFARELFRVRKAHPEPAT